MTSTGLLSGTVRDDASNKVSASPMRRCIECLGSVFPIVLSLEKYDRNVLQGDVVAGITIGIILIPQGLAYAQLAGLPAIWGLYTGLMPLIPFALLSPTPHISIGPFAICSLLSSQALLSAVDCDVTANKNPYPPNCEDDPDYLHAAIVLTFLVAGTQLFLSLIGAGEAISRVLSSPVTKAYCSACAFYIATSQIKNFLEISVRSTNSPLALFGAWYDTISRLHGANLYALTFGVSAVVIMLAAKYVRPKFPCELVVVIAGILFCYGLKYEDKLNIVGEFSGMPEFELPNIGKYGAELFGHSLLVTILTYIISISIVKNFAMKHNYAVRGNGHLFALGVANLIGAFFKCYPASGSLSRSVALEEAGGKTTVSSVISALLLLMTLGFMTSLFRNLPKSILAAIIFVALKNLFIRLRVGIDLWFLHQRYDFAVWWITLVGTMLVGMQYGVLVGMAASVAALGIQLRVHGATTRTISALYRSAIADASVHPLCKLCFGKRRLRDDSDEEAVDDGDVETPSVSAPRTQFRTVKGHSDAVVAIFSFGLPLCFLNMDSFREGILSALDAARDRMLKDRQTDKCRTILLMDFLGIDFIDASSMNMLERVVEDMGSRDEIVRPYFVACSNEILQQMQRAKMTEKFGANAFVDTLTRAASCAEAEIVRDVANDDDGVLRERELYFEGRSRDFAVSAASSVGTDRESTKLGPGADYEVLSSDGDA